MAMLKATKRSERGSRKAQKLREQGLIPGVIYGHGAATESITISEHDVEQALYHGERVLEIDVEGDQLNALIKDVQWDTFGQVVLHVDLTRVDLDERVEVAVNVHLRGTPVGTEEGGVLTQTIDQIQVACAVRSIPEEITHLVTEMKLNDTLTAGELNLPEGVELLEDPETVIASVTFVAEEPEEAEEGEGEEAPTEPELIGRATQEEEEGAEE